MKDHVAVPGCRAKRVFGQLSNVPSSVTGITGTPESIAR